MNDKPSIYSIEINGINLNENNINLKNLAVKHDFEIIFE